MVEKVNGKYYESSFDIDQRILDLQQDILNTEARLKLLQDKLAELQAVK